MCWTTRSSSDYPSPRTILYIKLLCVLDYSLFLKLSSTSTIFYIKLLCVRLLALSPTNSTSRAQYNLKYYSSPWNYTWPFSTFFGDLCFSRILSYLFEQDSNMIIVSLWVQEKEIIYCSGFYELKGFSQSSFAQSVVLIREYKSSLTDPDLQN